VTSIEPADHWTPPDEGSSSSEGPGNSAVEPASNDSNQAHLSEPETPPKRELLAKLLSRRSLLIGGGGAALAGIGWFFGDELKSRLAPLSNETTDDAADKLLDLVDADWVSCEVLNEYGSLYGTIDKNTAADVLDGNYDESSLEAIFQGGNGYLTCWSNIVVNFSTQRSDIIFTGIKFQIDNEEDLGDRRILMRLGGGDGVSIHAYITTQENKTYIRYTQEGQAADTVIKEPLEPGQAYQLEIAFIPMDPLIYEWTTWLRFQRASDPNERVWDAGSYRTSGIPGTDAVAIIADGTGVSEEPLSLFSSPLLQEVFPGIMPDPGNA
jgi:hypothetical protein